MDHVQVIGGAVRENRTAEVLAKAVASVKSLASEFARSLIDDRGKGKLCDEAKRKIQVEFPSHYRIY
jgi:hypothetical protein